MLPFFGGPHGAEQEQNEQGDFWQNVPEAGDTLPGTLPSEQEQVNETRQSSNAAQPGYVPAHGKYGASNSTDETDLFTDDMDNTTEETRQSTEQELTDPDSQSSSQDPLGSWTGVPDPDTEEVPTQNQDDL